MINPSLAAIATASARVDTASFPKIAPTWVFTVCSEMANRPAIA
jgi:hypothetical protein